MGPSKAPLFVRVMDTPSSPLKVQTVLILKADRIYAEALRQHVLSVFPEARVLTALTLDAARRILNSETIDLFITGVGTSLGCDVIDLLAHLTTPSRSIRILVVTVRLEYRVLAALRTLAIDGAFDSATSSPDELTVALQTLDSGKRYWSQSILDHMHKVGSASNALFRLLTNFEQVVLSVIGDGCDNVVAAQKLNLSPATVSTVRRELHRKLGGAASGRVGPGSRPARICALHGGRNRAARIRTHVRHVSIPAHPARSNGGCLGIEEVGLPFDPSWEAPIVPQQNASRRSSQAWLYARIRHHEEFMPDTGLPKRRSPPEMAG